MTTTRNAEATRERILQAAHEEIYEYGFQSFRIDAVLRKTQLAKGALYHYFPNKLALGYAVVDECIMGYFLQTWGEFLNESRDPLLALNNFFQKKCTEVQTGECFNGCPLNNLVQEMSTLDEGFHQRFQIVANTIITTVATALRQGQADGLVRKDINPDKIATFVLSCYHGIMGAVKCMEGEQLVDLFDTLGSYIESLRVTKS